MNPADTGTIDNASFSIMTITANLVSAYVSNNPVPVTELPALIDRVNAALVNLSEPVPPADEPRTPAISIKRSVTRSHIFCLEDGKKFKSLKRHLMAYHNMSPEEYRERWNLAPDYPVVAPEYAASRSAMAKEMGLGRKREVKTSTERIRAPKRRDRKSD
ncbi:Ros/MucR family transcriptional regulator [Pseudaminobacter sp. NGMCC 1.201702]|uniref:MucR family transcriptional regulator n=1 Tax=Pseudaminobacter sp. NGMCC 1.201702 TaxID=3391825 RepID=UPI0039F0342C